MTTPQVWLRRFGRAGVTLALLAIVVETADAIGNWRHAIESRGLDGGLYAIRIDGPGIPVVFLHGIRGSGRYWGEAPRRLAAAHGVLLVDLLGFGRSPWPAGEYTVDDHVGALDRTLRREYGDRPVFLVGHSMGAVVAAEYAARHRDRVKGLILLGPPVFKDRAEAESRISAMGPVASEFTLNPILGRASCDLECALRPLLRIVAPELASNVPPEVARDGLLHRWASYRGSLVHLILEAKVGDALKRAGPLPVAIVQGKTDWVSSPVELEQLARSANAPVTWIEGGHNAYLEHPEAAMTAIAAALERWTPAR